VKNDKQYEGLRKKGMSKSRAAAISNSPGSSSPGGKSSGRGFGGFIRFRLRTRKAAWEGSRDRDHAHVHKGSLAAHMIRAARSATGR
jgi:hypothetical protein